MRFLEAGPQGERLAAVLFQIPDSLPADVSAAHVVVVPREGQLTGIQPDAGRIAEGAPLGGLGGNSGGGGTRLYVRKPGPGDFALGHHDVEAVQAGRGGAVEVHLAENRGPVAGPAELFGQGRLVGRERGAQQRHAGRVRQLAGEERLARRSTHRRVAVVRGEARGLGRQAVEVGGMGGAVAVAAHHVAGMVVGQDEQEIGLPRGARGRLPARERRGSQAAQQGATADWG